MSTLRAQDLRAYLSKSITSLNRNKLNGTLAEIDFRAYLNELGYSDRVSAGGWIARKTGEGEFGHDTVAFFPEHVLPNIEYSPNRCLPPPPNGLHTICSTFHQIGIKSYYCMPTVEEENNPESVRWMALQLGIPGNPLPANFPVALEGFQPRQKRYNFLRYNTDVSGLPEEAVAEEFSKENIRVGFQNAFLSEMSDIDGILWGERYTYPLEIKEKTAAYDKKFGDYFGLDVGPFVKLAFYAAKRGNLHSIFVVREIDNVDSRNLVNWWYITFDKLAQYASWTPRPGGTNMGGGGSSTVMIPKAEFGVFNAAAIRSL